MNDEVCDRHPSARAKAMMLLDNGGILFWCGHCANTITYDGDFTIIYETVTV